MKTKITEAAKLILFVVIIAMFVLAASSVPWGALQ